MANLTWNEVRDSAVRFSARWSDGKSEAGDKQTFWNEFFAVFGQDRKVVASFEVAVQNIRGHYNHIDLLWPGVLLVEHKTKGQSLGNAESQAFAYIHDLARQQRSDEAPRYVIVSDFQQIALFDLEPENTKKVKSSPPFVETRFELNELHKHVREFSFLNGKPRIHTDPESPANQKAYDRMCLLHDELTKGGHRGPDLERFLVRILFCLFADDTGVFEPNAFQSFIENRTREDGSDLGARLNEMFDVLNTPANKRDKNIDDYLVELPYVNGDLFAERLAFSSFTRKMRQALLEATRFHWARVSPAVFGSLFQGVMLPKQRRQQGAHYTSEANIMKVLHSLFLNDLRREFTSMMDERSTRKKEHLKAFHLRLRELRFLDPASGCGNFLVLAYRELRRLELDVLRELHGDDRQRILNIRDLILLDVDQFYGIEQDEWPVRISEVALWLMDQQMNREASELFGQTYERLPLNRRPHIKQGNALELDWGTILPPSRCAFVLGNPPFVGKHLMEKKQADDMERVWEEIPGTGVLDYVTGWYKKAAEYLEATRIVVGFVSTNSITQGEQVGILWNTLYSQYSIKVHFAYQTFEWQSDARGKAHVHVVIIGFATFDRKPKSILTVDPKTDEVFSSNVKNISPYLREGPDLGIVPRRHPLTQVPSCEYGNKPTDGGHLILEDAEKDKFLKANPKAARYIRPLLCSEEYLHNKERWCLWLENATPEDIRNISGIRHRVEQVRRFRLSSPKEPTKRKASTPSLFAEIRQPHERFIVVPRHSSQSRKYIPFGYFEPKVIVHDSCSYIPGATLFHFGVLSSSMHMAWVRLVAGRLKSDYRYSGSLVYNTFPWPDHVQSRQRSTVEDYAQEVLAKRLRYLPPNGTSCLADLYDPLTMPEGLLKAHLELDHAVDRCFRAQSFKSDWERADYLLELYQHLFKTKGVDSFDTSELEDAA